MALLIGAAPGVPRSGKGWDSMRRMVVSDGPVWAQPAKSPIPDCRRRAAFFLRTKGIRSVTP